MWFRQEAAYPRSLRVEKYQKRQLITIVEKKQSGNQVIIVMQKLLGKQLSKTVASSYGRKAMTGKTFTTVVLLTASSGRI